MPVELLDPGQEHPVIEQVQGSSQYVDLEEEEEESEEEEEEESDSEHSYA